MRSLPHVDHIELREPIFGTKPYLKPSAEDSLYTEGALLWLHTATEGSWTAIPLSNVVYMRCSASPLAKSTSGVPKAPKVVPTSAKRRRSTDK